MQRDMPACHVLILLWNRCSATQARLEQEMPVCKVALFWGLVRRAKNQSLVSTQFKADDLEHSRPRSAHSSEDLT